MASRSRKASLPTGVPIWVARQRVTKTIAYTDVLKSEVMRVVLRRGLRADHEIVRV
jgi:hypothetical protein